MDTQSTQFDSYRFVKRLTNAGLSEEVAEILADEHTRLIVPADVATKADVGTVEAGVRAVRTGMATQAEVDARFDRVGAEMATKAEVDARFDQIRAEMATKAEVDARFDQIRAEMATKAEVDARFDQIRAEMATKAEVDARFDQIRAEMATKAEVDARFDQIRAEMATKEDLRREIAACEARMEQRLRNAILEAKVSLIKWMITTMMVFSGIVIGAVTALQ